MEYLGYLGCKLDAEKNNVRGEERIISTDDSKVIAMVVPTNEELAIARETVALVSGVILFYHSEFKMLVLPFLSGGRAFFAENVRKRNS